MKNMKKIILGLVFILSIISSCNKKLDSEFPNPEAYDKTGNLFGGLFTNSLYKWKVYVQDYGEWWWEIAGSGAMGVIGYTQIGQRYITDRYGWFNLYDDLSGTDGFGNATSLWQGRLSAFYGGAAGWVSIKDNIALVSGEELDNNKIYYLLATVVKDYSALLTVDFYNSIPYSEAFGGKDRVFFPKYDDPKSIYTSVLEELKSIEAELPVAYAKMTPGAISTFNVQDIAFQGNVQKWRQYINALRLKYAIRISGVDETLAKSHIQDVLSKNNLPTSDMTWKMPYAIDVQSGGEWLRGLNEAWPGTFIPNIIMKRMNYGTTKYEPGTDDPRLPVIAMPTKYSSFSSTPAVGDYRGVTMDADAAKPGYVAGERYYTGGPMGNIQENFAQDTKSQYSYVTYTRNSAFPVYMMSMAEVDLLLAEVAAKGYGSTGKTAADHLKDAITHSTDFWYARNAESTYGTQYSIMHPAKPSSGDITTYSNFVASRYNSKSALEDKMEIIMQQKFIHLNIMCPYELWSEQRRTRHPKLEPLTLGGKVMKPYPERLRYPTSEQSTNADNYATVKDQDNFTSPIFWVPQNLKTVNPYWDNYNYE